MNKYLGKPCRHGHSGVRYTKNNRCVECEADRDALRRPPKGKIMTARKLGKLAGEKTYHGAPCRYCGTTLKYTAYCSCVKCGCERASRRYREQRRKLLCEVVSQTLMEG